MLTLLKSELRFAYRRRGEMATPLVFLVLVCALFPLAISPEPQQLNIVAPGVIWIASILATLLSLDILFRHDFDDGSLEQLLFSKHSLYTNVLLRIGAHWLFCGLPMVLLSPALALTLFLSKEAYVALLLSLALGTPVLSLIGSIAAALTLSVKKSGLLVALLTLPLFMPVLIFGSNAVVSASQGVAFKGQLLFLLAFLVLGIVLAPFATAIAIKISVSND